MLAEAAEVRSQYEAELAGARHEAARIRQQAKEEGAVGDSRRPRRGQP